MAWEYKKKRSLWSPQPQGKAAREQPCCESGLQLLSGRGIVHSLFFPCLPGTFPTVWWLSQTLCLSRWNSWSAIPVQEHKTSSEASIRRSHGALSNIWVWPPWRSISKAFKGLLQISSILTEGLDKHCESLTNWVHFRNFEKESNCSIKSHKWKMQAREILVKPVCL